MSHAYGRRSLPEFLQLHYFVLVFNPKMVVTYGRKLFRCLILLVQVSWITSLPYFASNAVIKLIIADFLHAVHCSIINYKATLQNIRSSNIIKILFRSGSPCWTHLLGPSETQLINQTSLALGSTRSIHNLWMDRSQLFWWRPWVFLFENSVICGIICVIFIQDIVFDDLIVNQ